MNLGVLQCDEVPDQFRGEFGDYPDMFIRRIRALRPHWNFHVYRCFDGEFPKDTADCDGYLSTGSRFSVYDGHRWIMDLESFVRDVDYARKPYVGICFGHQMLAQALGGRVERASVGWGVGVHTTTVDANDELLGGRLPDPVHMVVSHQDQVTVLPEQMTVIGGSEFCPVYWCRVGEHMFSMQGHPEFSREYSSVLMDMRREILGETTFLDGKSSLETEPHAGQVFEVIVDFFESQR